MNSEDNGYATDDPPRDEGWQAKEGQGDLQRQAREAAAGAPGEARDRLITIENSAKEIKPFIVQKVTTVEELIQKICDRFPGMGSDALYMRVWSSKIGSIRRKSLRGPLMPDQFELYVSLYLKKHPSLFVS